MEPLETDTLYLAATRPAMVYGVPLTVFAILLMVAGFIIVLMRDPLYLLLMVPLFYATREVVARDYNAIGVVLLYLRTSGRSVDTRQWGGASVAPFPVRIRNRGRGMLDAGE